eukprot:TRINITY_DN4999_c0_g1_i2.p1 TRINITY_DN4999_c0_g1~~TRINITY_DN4999_c0_g1_i2.p1  ORF type:complete len:1125 (-),score=113.26 TRINITY_DN4999_c0_g1_i2:165-3137(-)
MRQVPRYSIRRGDIVWTHRDDAYPADLLLLATCDGRPSYVSTANLDGETTWKLRRPPSCVDGIAQAITTNRRGSSIRRTTNTTRKSVLTLNGLQSPAQDAVTRLLCGEVSVDVVAPQSDLNALGGKVKRGDSESLLTCDNLVARGCVQRHTAWTLGVALYVGLDTKTGLNTKGSLPKKVSALQRKFDTVVPVIALGICMVCAAAACAHIGDGVKHSFIRMFQYVIILQPLVPIGIFMCQPFLKRALCYHISRDETMVHTAKLEGATPRTEDIVDDLGLVEYVFTDKTGTLTQNEMRFARCCIAAYDLGDFRCSDAAEEASLSDGVLATQAILKGGNASESCNTPSREIVHRFFLDLALCHDVQVTVAEDGIAQYSGMSAEEVAFVETADDVGITLCERNYANDKEILSLDIGQERLDFEVVAILPFTSDRKRMSVLSKNLSTGQFTLATKGADSVMKPLLGASFSISESDRLLSYARMGLRTMLFGHKDVDSDFAKQWQVDLLKVKETPDEDERAAAIREMYARLECDLQWAGSVALEDRLQDGVPDTIKSLVDAGIKVWMLTGDQVETAIEIAKTCCMIAEGQTYSKLVGILSPDDALPSLQRVQADADAGVSSVLVVDGISLHSIFQSQQSQDLLAVLAKQLSACVCCRLSPQQKASLVGLVRSSQPDVITLAIGDGANDVPMIRTANVGIGMHGTEGNQAVLASDFAVWQFRFLRPLLFSHGRQAYWRYESMICFYCYKHLAVLIAEIVYGVATSFNGQTLYPATPLVLFYSWSGLPLLFCLISRHTDDVDLETALSQPHLYKDSQKRQKRFVFSWSVWMFLACWHGATCLFAAYFQFAGTESQVCLHAVTEPNGGHTSMRDLPEEARTASLVLVCTAIFIKSTFVFSTSASRCGLILVTSAAAIGLLVFIGALIALDAPGTEGTLHGIASTLAGMVPFCGIIVAVIMPDVALYVWQQTSKPYSEGQAAEGERTSIVKAEASSYGSV